HTVGRTLLTNPGMELQRAIAMVDSASEVADCPRGNAERHVSVSDAKQTLAVHSRVKRALQKVVRLFELAEPVGGTAKVRQHPRPKAGIGVLAAIEPAKRAEVRLRRRVELFLLLEHVTQVGIDRPTELRIIRRSRRGRDLQ